MNDDDSVFETAREENRGGERRRHAATIAEGLEGIEAYRNQIDRPLLSGLELYLTHRIATGDFLRAVLENNLAEAVGRMHPSLNADTLRLLVELLHNYFPASSYGSPEAVAKWVEG